MNYWIKAHSPYLRPETALKSNDSFLAAGAGAFFGAFFAFIFGLITFYLQKKLERYWKHRNSIVELEHLLQDNLDKNSANQFLLSGAISTLKKNHMTFTLLTKLRIPMDINLKIGNLELLNKYFDYKEPLEKINHGMETWMGMNSQLQQSINANPQLLAPIVHKNMDHLERQAVELDKFLKGLDGDTKYLLAYVRLFMKNDKHIWSVLWHRINNPQKPFISEADIKKEMKFLQSEIDKISKESRKKIEKIMNS